MEQRVEHEDVLRLAIIGESGVPEVGRGDLLTEEPTIPETQYERKSVELLAVPCSSPMAKKDISREFGCHSVLCCKRMLGKKCQAISGAGNLQLLISHEYI